MTGPEDSHSSTRPISVAELLAKNGTIGAPPVGGRRRRRRGDSDSVTVAELTGEIPIVQEHDDVSDAETTRTIPAVTDAPVATNGVGHADREQAVETERADDDEDDDLDDPYADAVADYSAHIDQRDADADLADFFAPPPRRPQYKPDTRRFGPVGRGAEQMSPDPVDEDEDLVLADAPETTSCRPTCGPREARCSAAKPSPTTWPGVAPGLARRTSTSNTTTTATRRRRRHRRSCARRGSSASASSRSRSVRAFSSRSTSCGSGTTSSPWCCRCWSSWGWSSACGWCARPRTSAAR
jgi:hypothetical protein